MFLDRVIKETAWVPLSEMVQDALVELLRSFLLHRGVFRRSVDELLLEKKIFEVVDLIVFLCLSSHKMQVKYEGRKYSKNEKEPFWEQSEGTSR